MPMGISTFTYLDISCLHGRVSKKAHTYLGNRHIIYARSLLEKHFMPYFLICDLIFAHGKGRWTLHNRRSLYWAMSIFHFHYCKNQICFLRQVMILPHLYLSRIQKLRFRDFEVLFVLVVALVLSEFWKWLEKIFCFLGNENKLSFTSLTWYFYCANLI